MKPTASLQEIYKIIMKKTIINKSILTFLFVSLTTLFLACSKEEIKENNEVPYTTITKDEALSRFARILSEALSSESELREFLKQEALKKYDNDTDVFIPWILDSKVTRNKTFFDYIIKYASMDELETIQRTVPCLSIYIPDWSWISSDAFSVTKWDTADNMVAVSINSSSDSVPMYIGGKYAGKTMKGDFFCSPILIVKDNDKMKQIGSATKAGDMVFDFADEAFDGRRSTKGHGIVIEYTNLGTYDGENAVASSSLKGRIKSAFKESQKHYKLCQRDHIYYGMTASVDTGWCDFHYKEAITMFRLKVDSAFFYNENTGEENGDYHYVLVDMNSNNTSNINRTFLSYEQIQSKAWGTGTIKIKAHVLVGSSPMNIVIDVPFSDAFFVETVEQKREENWLGATMWRNYYTLPKYLKAKWIECAYELFTWDLSRYPVDVRIDFEEYDQSTSLTRSQTITNKYAQNFKITLGGEVTIPVKEGISAGAKLGFEYGNSNTEEQSNTYSYTVKDESDDLGTIFVQYKDPVITTESSGKSYFKYYQLSGMDVVVSPIKM